MKPWKQALLVGALGIVGAMAGLGAATLAFGPSVLLGSDAGQWVVRHVFGQGPTLPDGREVVAPGDPVPALAVSKLDGTAHTLRSEGRPILINFWASWCPPCVEEMPLLDAFAAAQGQGGVQVIGIALDEPDEINAFLARHPVRFPIYQEESSDTDSSALLGNVRGVLPYSVLIDAEGHLKKRKMGSFGEGELERWTQD